jgi:hypothetical protein
MIFRVRDDCAPQHAPRENPTNQWRFRDGPATFQSSDLSGWISYACACVDALSSHIAIDELPFNSKIVEDVSRVTATAQGAASTGIFATPRRAGASAYLNRALITKAKKIATAAKSNPAMILFLRAPPRRGGGL